MRSNWPCAPAAAVALLLLAAWPPEAAAGPGQRDGIHRVYKVKVLTETHQQLGKRGGDRCPSAYFLCPKSLGGCCPDAYGCAKDSCTATTAATSTCQGHVGYYACGMDVGGGCCQQGLICATGEYCAPPVGVTSYTQTCPTGYFLCPSSFNYGCCQTGMGCGTDACYNTSPSTILSTYETTQGGSVMTITFTSVSTPVAPTAVPSDSNVAVLKLIPSTASKVQPTPTGSSDSNGGLSSAALGGIIGGACALLVIVLIASFFIIKRLRHTEKVVIEQRESTSGTGTRRTDGKMSTTQVSVIQIQPTPSQIDDLDCDPLMMESRATTPTRPNRNRGRTSRADSEMSGLTSIISSQARFRTPSADSFELNGSYFSRSHDYVSNNNRNSNNNPVRNSTDTQQMSRNQYQQHGNNCSNASELSNGSDDVSVHGMGSPLIPFELGTEGAYIPELPGSDTETERSTGRERSSGTSGISMSSIVSPISTVAVSRPPFAFGRRRSDSTNTSRSRGRSDSNNNNNNGRGRSDSNTQALGIVDEEALHGYYGSPIVDLSQTNADMSIMQAMGANFTSFDDDLSAHNIHNRDKEEKGNGKQKGST